MFALAGRIHVYFCAVACRCIIGFSTHTCLFLCIRMSMHHRLFFAAIFEADGGNIKRDCGGLGARARALPAQPHLRKPTFLSAWAGAGAAVFIKKTDLFSRAMVAIAGDGAAPRSPQ